MLGGRRVTRASSVHPTSCCTLHASLSCRLRPPLALSSSSIKGLGKPASTILRGPDAPLTLLTPGLGCWLQTRRCNTKSNWAFALAHRSGIQLQ